MIMRLIEPNELEKVLRPILTDESCPLHIAADIDMNIDLMPKVDAVPVRHGWWKCSDKYENAVCSVCGYDTGEAYSFGYGNGCYNFCPMCGADMRRKAWTEKIATMTEPTEKQVMYAKYLAQRMCQELPKEYTKKAYSDFIEKWKPIVKHEDDGMNEPNAWRTQYI